MLEPASKEKLAGQLRAWRGSKPLFLDSFIPGVDNFQLNSLSSSFSVEDLDALEISPKLVLGKRIEQLFAFWLDQSSDFKLLQQNLQVIHEQVTLGEIDFILQNLKSQEVHHVELVHKFYLYHPSNNTDYFDRWVGPNKSDTLSRKMNKLKRHQFPLLYKPETQKLLNELGVNLNGIKQSLCFNASLFIPVNHPLDGNPSINFDCLAGSWLRYSDLINLKYQDDLFYIPAKENWILDPHHEVDWMKYSEFKERVQIHLDRKISPMCWMNCEGSLYRFFTVWW